MGPEIQGVKDFYDAYLQKLKIRISSTLQVKVPVPHLTLRLLPNPVRVPNLVIMYNEIVLFCAFQFFQKESLFSFLYHYEGMSLVLTLSKIKV